MIRSNRLFTFNQEDDPVIMLGHFFFDSPQGILDESRIRSTIFKIKGRKFWFMTKNQLLLDKSIFDGFGAIIMLNLESRFTQARTWKEGRLTDGSNESRIEDQGMRLRPLTNEIDLIVLDEILKRELDHLWQPWFSGGLLNEDQHDEWR